MSLTFDSAAPATQMNHGPAAERLLPALLRFVKLHVAGSKASGRSARPPTEFGGAPRGRVGHDLKYLCIAREPPQSSVGHLPSPRHNAGMCLASVTRSPLLEYVLPLARSRTLGGRQRVQSVDRRLWRGTFHPGTTGRSVGSSRSDADGPTFRSFAWQSEP